MKQDKAKPGRFFGVVVLIPSLFIGGWLLMQCKTKRTDIRHVVLISIGTCRADHLSCYGFHKQTTPNIDKIAGQGVLFENVVSPAPITLPAHVSLLTGTNPPFHGIHGNLHDVLPEEKLTLAEILKNNGFHTGGVVSALVLDAQFGIDQGFEFYQDDWVKINDTASSSERPGHESTKIAINWLEEHKNENFFLFLHYHDPHFDYQPPEPFKTRYADDLYSGEIAFTDDCIGGVTTKLKELGIYDSTLLIITGDHGEMLGEHGEKEHLYFIYESAIKVPLIVKLPGSSTSKPVRIRETVGLIDIVPTICELLDIEISKSMQGMSLVPFLQGKESLQTDRYFYIESMIPTYLGANPLLGIRTDDRKYIQSTRPELYDLKNDPKEQVNLVQTQPKLVEMYGTILGNILKEQRSASPMNRVIPAQDILNRLASLGYIGAEVSKHAFAIDPNLPDPKDLIGLHEGLKKVQQLKFEKKFSEAKKILEELAVQEPHFKIYDHLGEIALQEKNIDQSIAYYSRSLELNSNSYHANLDMGVMMTRKGKPQEAAAHFQKAAASRPYDTKAPRNLGILLERMGKVEEARNYFLKVLAQDPKDTIALNHMGTSMLTLGQEQEAMRYFMESIKINRKQPVTLGVLAQIKTANPGKPYYDPAGAVQLALEACGLTQFNQPELLSILASAYITSGQIPKAIETAEQALKVSRAAGKPNLVRQLMRQLELLKKTPH